MNLAATADNSVAHGLDDGRQLVGAEVGMSIRKDGCAGSVLAEDIEYFLHTASFLAARVEFAVREGTRTSLAKGEVGLGVNCLLARDEGYVLAAVVHILSSFNDDGTNAQLYKPKSGEESARASSDYDGLRLALNVGVVGGDILIVGGELIYIGSDGEVYIYSALTGIYASLEHSDGRKVQSVHAFFFYEVSLYGLFACRLLR